ncbi:hydrolase TatD [Verrucomicrobia bacterium IMCC26134]|nr:hydrolase TatD [Verrucomicrobia bacterium IMCC26134]
MSYVTTLIDTHTHLDGFEARGETEAALARARAAGVEAMITIGTGSDDWTIYRGLAERYPGEVFYTVGLHPCSVQANWAEEVAQIEGFWGGAGARPVALGECGLDHFHLPKEEPAREELKAWQRGAFAAQLEIAKRAGCPLVIHSRAAFAECVAMIDASGVDWSRVVLHCFSEGAAEMGELVRRGAYGSFTGVVTYKNAESARDAMRGQGLARLMIETDAPYLTPVPHRGKPNEPAYLRLTAEYAATVLGVSYAELAETTTRTARAFFGI